MWNLENESNFTTYNGEDDEGYQEEEVLGISFANIGGTNLAIGLLSVFSLLVFAAIVFAVCRTLSRSSCVKWDTTTSAERQLESADAVLVKPSAAGDLQKPRRNSDEPLIVQTSLGQDLLESVTKELLPTTRPTSTVNYYHHKHPEKQQQQQQQQPKQQQPLSATGVVSMRDQSLLMTSNSTETNSCNNRAQIWFSVTYKDNTTEESQPQISVYISKVELDASPSELLSEGDGWLTAFVCAYLLSDESYQLKTRMVKRTGTSLVFDQTLVFKLGHVRRLAEPLQIRLSVYRIDQRRLRHTLGHVITTLDDRCEPPESNDVAAVVCKDLVSDEELLNYNSRGEIHLSMTYDPEANRLKVTVIEARGFSLLDTSKDPYVRVDLLTVDQLQKSRRISLRKMKTSDFSSDESAVHPTPPDKLTFKKTVHFTLPVNHLDISSVRVSVLTTADRPAGQSGEVDIEYGRTTLGPCMFARADQLAHWTAVTAQPCETVTMWHRLTSPHGRCQ